MSANVCLFALGNEGREAKLVSKRLSRAKKNFRFLKNELRSFPQLFTLARVKQSFQTARHIVATAKNSFASHTSNGNYLRQRVKKGHSVSDAVEQDKKSLDSLVSDVEDAERSIRQAGMVFEDERAQALRRVAALPGLSASLRTEFLVPAVLCFQTVHKTIQKYPHLRRLLVHFEAIKSRIKHMKSLISNDACFTVQLAVAFESDVARVRASLHRYLSEIEAEKRQFDQLVKELYVELQSVASAQESSSLRRFRGARGPHADVTLQAQQIMHQTANVLEESFVERRLDRIAFGVTDKLEPEFYRPPAHVVAAAKAARVAARPWLSLPSESEDFDAAPSRLAPLSSVSKLQYVVKRHIEQERKSKACCLS